MSQLATSTTCTELVSRRWFGWLILFVAAAGCSSTPWGKCQPCVTPCDVAPACWGYFPTCWRPWPCAHPCPVYDLDSGFDVGTGYDAGTGYEAPAPEVVPFDAMPDPAPPPAEVDTSLHHESYPAANGPIEHVSPLIPTIDPNLTDTAQLQPQLRPLFRPLPKTTDEQSGVITASWPATPPSSSEVILTGAQTPSSPRALSTVEFVEQ